MKTTCIADVLQTRKRFMRSIHLTRDFGNADMQDYVVTPQAKATLHRLLLGLAPHSQNRAWRITGDYGTGKSSFALALARLLSEANQKSQLHGAANFRQLGISRPQLLPVLVTGSREPIVTALLRSLKLAVESCRSSVKRTRLLERTQYLLTAAPTSALDSSVVGLVEEAASYVCATGQGTGLLIVLDELGKFLEFASLHPDRQDVFFLQELAEAATRSDACPIFVIGVLHQGFNSYAEQLSHVTQREWEKVAGRFEEVLFNQPLDQTAELVANALNVRIKSLPNGLVAETEQEMNRTLELGWYGQSPPRQTLLKTAPKLYPLHPTVLPVLVRLFSRFGQNERSIYSFMFSEEPFALQEFAARPIEPASFFCLHHLYDYTRAVFGSRLGSQSYRSHWNQIESVVESFPREDGEKELQLLKTIALLNLVDIPNLLATDEALKLALHATTPASLRKLNEAIRHLQKDMRALYYRGASGGYCLWPHTSVNLERAYEQASMAIGTPQRVSELLHGNLDTRPIVARRHYIETGNLRHFSVCYSTVSDLAASLRNEQSSSTDAQIVVPLCETEEERLEALAFAHSTPVKKRPDILIAVPKPLGALVGLVQECQRWEWISQNILELNSDRYAAEEVSRQMAASRQVLEKRIRNYIGLRQLTDKMELQWFHRGRSISISNSRELSSALSKICDSTYTSAPRIHNELVNRHVLSSAAAAARMRLIERILSYPSQQLLGMDPIKKPPEMSMYLSVLKQAGLHRAVDGSWAIVEPESRSDVCALRPVFQHILEILQLTPDSRIPVSEVFRQLRRRPYGVRDGLSPLLLAVFTVAHEQNIAFYENGVFLRHLSGEEFLRLTKAPESFEIQYCQVAGVRAAVFEKLIQLLHPEQMGQRSPEILDVVRPLCQFAAQLPAFTHHTTLLSREAIAIREALLHAEEPTTLLFKAIPLACGFQPFQNNRAPNATEIERFVVVLRGVLDELKAAYPDLLTRIGSAFITAFDRPGSFDKFRPEISGMAARIVVTVSDSRLKALCFRLADTNLPNQAWIESVGSLLCAKPPSKWVDSDAERFATELKQLAGQFQRVEAMTFDHSSKNAGRSAIRVSVTQQDGIEVDRVLYVSAEEEAEVAGVEVLITRILIDSSRVGLVAATRALGKALTAVDNTRA